MRQISLYLTPEQYKQLKNWNEKTGSSYGSLIRQLLTDYFERSQL